MVSLALIAELSDARGVSRLRHCNGFCTLRLSLPADWAQKKYYGKKTSPDKPFTRVLDLFCMFFWACRGRGLDRRLTPGPAPACISCCWGTLFPPTFLPRRPWGWRWGWPALLPPPPATPGAQDAASRRKSRRSSKGNGYSNKRRMSRHPLPRVCTIIRTINH